MVFYFIYFFWTLFFLLIIFKYPIFYLFLILIVGAEFVFDLFIRSVNIILDDKPINLIIKYIKNDKLKNEENENIINEKIFNFDDLMKTYFKVKRLSKEYLEKN